MRGAKAWLIAAGLLPFLPAMAWAAGPEPTLSGDWVGVLAPLPGHGIPLVLHVTGSAGHWAATLDSPSQGALGLHAQAVTQQGRAVAIRLAAPPAGYDATLSQNGQTLSGTWSQGAGALPLTMRRGRTATDRADPRPQTPHPPFPYRSEDVAYDNDAGHAHLAGTLTLPAGAGPFPAVLLVTGSGLQDRDETLFGHKPFLLWADGLTRRGIAVLRVDDRQTGGSTGEVARATTADFAGDAAAGVAFLRSRAAVDPHRIGVMGHSEGAIIAALLAARDPAISFVVMLAGSGEPGEQLLLQQKRQLEQATGVPDAEVDQSVATMRTLYDAVRTTRDQKEADAALLKAWQAVTTAQGHPSDTVPPAIRVVASPWFRWFLAYDPRTDLEKIRCPVLALGGSKDIQVEANTNLETIRTALRNDHDATVRELPGLNHLFQTADTGLPAEYGTIRETIAPIALQTVEDWIVARTGIPATASADAGPAAPTQAR
ncbi:alpha/beta hydrolase family protein [Gluconacetobacter sp. Hr-1-5]|uniref:alpha/beta hydrolase family protein n=1 Tax=Gluconacetobacter sp. Hr-1-5 TaxID=3395370 RepID=UPI003B51B996